MYKNNNKSWFFKGIKTLTAQNKTKNMRGTVQVQ